MKMRVKYSSAARLVSWIGASAAAGDRLHRVETKSVAAKMALLVELKFGISTCTGSQVRVSVVPFSRVSHTNIR